MTAKEITPGLKSYKRPESVLVVVYTVAGEVLLLQRADSTEAWQSVTGSMEWDERLPIDTARRELFEETGISAPQGLTQWPQTNRYPIHPLWKPKYHPQETHNTEHVFSLQLPGRVAISLSPNEHRDYSWRPMVKAIDLIRFASNRAAVRALMEKAG